MMTIKRTRDEVAAAILAGLISPNVADSNSEPANVVDVLDDLSRATWAVSRSVDGAAASFKAIADAIFDLADAVRDQGRHHQYD